MLPTRSKMAEASDLLREMQGSTVISRTSKSSRCSRVHIPMGARYPMPIAGLCRELVILPTPICTHSHWSIDDLHGCLISGIHDPGWKHPTTDRGRTYQDLHLIYHKTYI